MNSYIFFDIKSKDPILTNEYKNITNSSAIDATVKKDTIIMDYPPTSPVKSDDNCNFCDFLIDFYKKPSVIKYIFDKINENKEFLEQYHVKYQYAQYPFIMIRRKKPSEKKLFEYNPNLSLSNCPVHNYFEIHYRNYFVYNEIWITYYNDKRKPIKNKEIYDERDLYQDLYHDYDLGYGLFKKHPLILDYNESARKIITEESREKLMKKQAEMILPKYGSKSPEYLAYPKSFALPREIYSKKMVFGEPNVNDILSHIKYTEFDYFFDSTKLNNIMMLGPSISNGI